MKFLILALAVAVVSAQVHHHDIAQMVDQAFLRLDVNPKDGLLEFEELNHVFTLRDTDKDGKLSYAEFSAHAVDNAMRHELFNHFDTDKDGFLQKAEMVDNNFNAMDQNGDNEVSRHDFDHYYTNIIQHLLHNHNGR
uniref:Uncharacterized protein LOC111113285 n=1 Tax=Crassostrea virginica TaxID=6565 RepID=A0A8B8DEX3_CRAVI|nr:uncharacterized protein LOC111113285 [Crassostrea virginica]XP_022326498.1 uncharacterized protein LOC111126273 [Crassostrea virginica]